MKKKRESPAMTLVRLVWDNALGAGPNHSWERINGAMRAAVGLAISAGLRFEPGDFQEMAESFDMNHWAGTDPRGGTYGEWFYSQAVSSSNLSAAQSFEQWRGRGPFIFDNCDGWSGYGMEAHGTTVRRTGRLAVGVRLQWPHRKDGQETVTVTSFAGDGLSLTACSYRQERYEKKVLHRYRITREDLAANKAMRKQAAKLRTARAKSKFRGKQAWIAAEAAGIKWSVLERIERGEITPTEKQLAALTKVYEDGTND